MARQILANPRIQLATAHVSGVADQATARQNVIDTSEGRAAHRSDYENAPGGTTPLRPVLLDAILQLAESFELRISELAGGSHSPRSRHYLGVALDVSALNGEPVSQANVAVPSFVAALNALGATEVLGPPKKGHAHHVHGAWPRPRG